ncbi:MAG: aminotransferase class V-fold PLP-dependent enzyme [Deltaproteobacteria bacterium]|nr:aminotransferase class V-fold PLP-dependent enzyme [Deltaproteobacteria bacterium]
MPSGQKLRHTQPMPPSPEELRQHYSWFLRKGRILLTGHSHQAWPDVAREAQLEAFDDAALWVDDKWERAFQAGEDVRKAVATRIGCSPKEIVLGANTHELVMRFLSALPLRKRPRLITTQGEFHSIRRQLARLAEEGLEIVWIQTHPVESLAERLVRAIDDRTSAILVSAVLYESAHLVPNLGELVALANRQGVEVLIDAYHAFQALPFCVKDWGERAFITGGGYKYAQWGEGNCFLRVPSDFDGKPFFTGWFAEFFTLDHQPTLSVVTYPSDPAYRFAGSTYDPTSHYRARAVARFFDAQGLTPQVLREIYMRQTELIFERLGGYFELFTPRTPLRGAFVALRVDAPSMWVNALRQRGIYVDARGSFLRIGPAPYITDAEIEEATAAMIELKTKHGYT